MCGRPDRYSGNTEREGERGRDSGKEVSGDTAFNAIATGTSLRLPRAAAGCVYVIFLPIARAFVTSFTGLQPFKCSVIVNIQAWHEFENLIFLLDQQSEGTPVLNTNVIAPPNLMEIRGT